ncbi:MAG: hypothetical protein ACREN5_16465 [Gemmatimonadales bacterium]
MAETIRKVEYFYATAPNKAGEGARLLALFKNAGVNLLAFSGFPSARRSQLDFVPTNPTHFLSVAKANGVKLKGPKTGFVVEGDDRVGAIADLLGRLAAAKLNVTAVDAVCAGAGRFGAILWVKPKDVARATQVLGAM